MRTSSLPEVGSLPPHPPRQLALPLHPPSGPPRAALPLLGPTVRPRQVWRSLAAPLQETVRQELLRLCQQLVQQRALTPQASAPQTQEGTHDAAGDA